MFCLEFYILMFMCVAFLSGWNMVGVWGEVFYLMGLGLRLGDGWGIFVFVFRMGMGMGVDVGEGIDIGIGIGVGVGVCRYGCGDPTLQSKSTLRSF